MKIVWRCTTDGCEEYNEFETRSDLRLYAADEEESFTDTVYCWQCGEPHNLSLDVKMNIERA